MSSIDKSHYMCDLCGRILKKGQSDEDAASEFAQNFPEKSVEDAGIVCDDCFKWIFDVTDEGVLQRSANYGRMPPWSTTYRSMLPDKK